MNIGNNIKQILEEKKIKAAHLAKAIDVSKSSFSRYLKNEQMPSAEIIAKSPMN